MAAPDIRIDIASEFKDRGFKRASRSATALDRQFKSLGRTFITVFSARAIIRFTERSVKAFAEEDRAVRALAGSLNNLGLAFQGANTEKFIEQLENTVSVAGGELRPAFQSLATATLDIAKSQQLLGLALDISAATGRDLASVTRGLTRAYLGNVSSLARLNVGLTAAELKTMDFAEAQTALTARFGGQAAAAADSYQGKINAMTIAFDKARESVGEKFIRSLEILGEGDFDKVLTAIANAADAVGNGFIRASYGIQKVKALLRGDFDQISKLQEQMNLELGGGFGARGRVPAAQLQRQTQQQTSLLRKLENERKKAAEAEKKRVREQQALRRAGTVFDMEAIQITAALQGKVTEDQRLRLTALLAIQQKNVDAADKLSTAVLFGNAAALSLVGVTVKAGDDVDKVITKLINAQTKVSLAAMGIADIPKAKNPFEEWPDILAKIIADLSKVNTLVAGSTGASTVSIPSTTGASTVPVVSPSAPAIIPSTVPQEVSNAGLVFGAGLSTAATAPSVTINVNVEGTVTSADDLVNTIRNGLYQSQTIGNPITVRRTQI